MHPDKFTVTAGHSLEVPLQDTPFPEPPENAPSAARSVMYKTGPAPPVILQWGAAAAPSLQSTYSAVLVAPCTSLGEATTAVPLQPAPLHQSLHQPPEPPLTHANDLLAELPPPVQDVPREPDQSWNTEKVPSPDIEQAIMLDFGDLPDCTIDDITGEQIAVPSASLCVMQ